MSTLEERHQELLVEKRDLKRQLRPLEVQLRRRTHDPHIEDDYSHGIKRLAQVEEILKLVEAEIPKNKTE